jgi:hypothetical protein
MARCQAQRGFLALRRCDDEALVTCVVCGRSVCPFHQVDDRCTECADAGADWRTDPRGPSRFRRRFYQEDHWVDDHTLFWGYDSYGFSGGHDVDETGAEGSSWDS